jgi:hypothetical protein
MLLPVHVRRNWNPSPSDLLQDYEANPTHWGTVADVCEIIFGNTAKWLNDVYKEASDLLDQLLGLDNYRVLWGWDVPGRARHPISSTGAFGSQGAAPPAT